MSSVGTINIASHLAVMAEQQPETDAVITCLGGLTEGHIRDSRTTYRQLNDRSDALARGSASIGITRGMRTALCVRPGLDFFAVTFALFKLGAVPVLIDPGIGVRNFGRCLSEAEPEAFIGIPAAHVARRVLGWARRTVRICVSTSWFGGVSLQKLERLGSATHSLEGDTSVPPMRGVCDVAEPQSSTSHVACTGGRPVSQPTRSAGHSVRIMVDSAPDDPAAILFTSGSTGPPKGVLYTHRNFDAQVLALREIYDIRPGEIDLATFPLFGLFGPALGMTTVVPKMDFTRPGHVKPQNILEPIRQFGITDMFGSPALLDRVGAWAAGRGVMLPSLKRVISAGAPVPAGVIERFASMLPQGAQVFTPYGATEALPVASIGSDEILRETRTATDQGKGVCVGPPAAGMRVKIIRITDEPIENWADDLELPAGKVGEIVVQGDVVTREYFNRPSATKLSKIADAGDGTPSAGTPGEGWGGGVAPVLSLEKNASNANPHPCPPPEYRRRGPEEHRGPEQRAFWHRMGDVGYFDAVGRLWFCGRKSQRVRMPVGDLFSAPFEGVFNTHPRVARSALVGVECGGAMRPVMCIELKSPRGDSEARAATGVISASACCKQPNLDQIRQELRSLAAQHEHTRIVEDFLFHPSFPVDIRHNAKIGREKLALWAARKLR